MLTMNSGNRTSPKSSETLRNLLKSSIMAALTSALSLITIPLPFSPVPVTGQSLGVMLAGLSLGPWWGALSMSLYLGIGAFGFPVFSGGRSGFSALLGPTGGYLWGFVAGAWVTGFISQLTERLLTHRPGTGSRRMSLTWLFCFLSATIGGIVVVHLAGVYYLARVTGRTIHEAFLVGSLPFLIGDFFKAAAGALVAVRLERFSRPHRV